MRSHSSIWGHSSATNYNDARAKNSLKRSREWQTSTDLSVMADVQSPTTIREEISTFINISMKIKWSKQTVRILQYPDYFKAGLLPVAKDCPCRLQFTHKTKSPFAQCPDPVFQRTNKDQRNVKCCSRDDCPADGILHWGFPW